MAKRSSKPDGRVYVIVFPMSLEDAANFATIVTGVVSLICTGIAVGWLAYQVYKLTRETDRSDRG